LLFFSSLFTATLNSIVTIIFWFFMGYPHMPRIEDHWKTFFISGALLAFRGVFVLYPIVMDRTPLLLVEVLTESSFMWSIPVSRLLLVESDPEKRAFCQWKPLIAIVLILWGITLCFAPHIIWSIQNHPPSLPPGFNGAWPVIFCLGVICGSLYNVVQEKYFKDRSIVFGRHPIYDLLVLNLFSSVVAFVLIASLFWIEFIPYFGSSFTVTSFIVNATNSTACLFNPECHSSLYYMLVYIPCLYLQLLFSSILNVESSNFVNFILILGIPILDLFWFIVPGSNPEGQGASLSIWGGFSLLFILIGGVVWRSWETKEKKLKFLQVEQVNSYEYFDSHNY